MIIPARRFLTALLILFSFQVQAAEWRDSPAVGELFRAAGVSGTFVLHDESAQVDIGHDRTRAETRYSPASTFKIPNSLIGLTVGAVTSVDEVLPYPGHPNPFSKDWEKDMGLREAIGLSNVPIYKVLARRIGRERMREYLARLDYGNLEIGEQVDNFWLGGPLRISAIEQTRFLVRLGRATLPLPTEAQRQVREIILLDQGPDWKLFGKTGWENAPGPGIGWWVGWLEKDGRIYPFALNMEMRDATDAARRVDLGKASLKALGILR